jgi:hypothetical protein
MGEAPKQELTGSAESVLDNNSALAPSVLRCRIAPGLTNLGGK